MDERALHERLDLQHGVISRRQVLELGGADSDIKRLVRRREWARVYEGVYVNHTGPLAWGSRAWAAVLFYWPAALSHESAVYLAGEVIHVAVGRHRSVVRLPGVEATPGDGASWPGAVEPRAAPDPFRGGPAPAV